jgi:hypothetical protein
LIEATLLAAIWRFVAMNDAMLICSALAWV